MKNYQTYDLSQQDQWNYYFNRLEDKDIYFSPKYCELYERNGDGKAILFIYHEQENFVYYPFFIRSLKDLPESINPSSGEEFFDITTPYGYGGPNPNLKGCEDEKGFLHRFHDVFHQYCVENNIITEFIRFHPLLQNQKYFDESFIHYSRNTVYIDTSIDKEEIWENYHSTHRNRIRKSLKNNFKIRHRSLKEHKDFRRLYYSTMNKNNALDYYYFSEQYLNNIEDLLEDNVYLVEVLLEGEVVVSSYFLQFGSYFHYHLLGSDEKYLNYLPGHFLIHYMSIWAKDKGAKYFHLGGGYSSEDLLLRFKKRFNKTGQIPFFVGKRIHCEEKYVELTKEILHQEDSYFPMYRHPKLFTKEVEVNS
ncbi:GNAT family N-acetyltransferase [Bacillus sp. 2205SS5-2]|uniref:GNAT family N-acetyltransferase n=1 Tax=Bacillus sp. 2205SS5-2 TaxID=3109031 RepID=UPI003007537C